MSRELWRDCAAWLTRCDVLRPDHKANWPEAGVLDLAYTLRDGVLLCNLLNVLDPGCIDMKEVNQKPQMAQFLCLRNIKTFLHTCQTVFGLKESDIFEPSMLFDLSDFLKVLHTLSKLSNCPKVQRKSIPGFAIHHHRSLSQEDIYRNLNSSDEEPHHGHHEEVEYGSYYSRIRNEEVYHDLCCIDGGAVGASGRDLQTSKRFVGHHVGDPGAVSIGHEKRDFVINELVETEANYVQVLASVLQCFYRPLSSVLREEDSVVIFAGIKELSEIHTGFLEQLRIACGFTLPDGCAQAHKDFRLGDVFLKWRARFLIYGDYCTNLPRAQSLLQTLCSRSELINQEVIKCQQEANNGKFKLRDILSVPMQRILKYHLLLEKLVSETPQNHEDYRGVERAKEAMVDVAQYINEVKKDSDTLDLMRDIQKSISDWNMPENTELKDYGRLLKDGELRIKAHDDQKIKVRYVFIFDQVMLMCKTVKGEQFKFRECLRLWEYKVEDVVGRRTLRSDARWSYQWYLIHKTERTAFTLYARTEDLKRKWIKAIADALDNINPAGCKNTDHKFQMHTFERTSTCNHCSKFLKGRIFQGYRCERCLISVHKSCIPNSGRCGHARRQENPPQLPPRPPPCSPSSHPVNSHRLNAHEEGAHAHQGNMTAWELSPPDELLPLPCQHSLNVPLPSHHLWFVGEMGRERASALLERERDGTFLVRIRPRGPTNPSETAFALSLKTDSKVKHMKVYEREENGVPHFFLSESRFFPTIVDLVNCYEQTSLGENFVGLDVTLQWPYGRTEAIVEFDFEPTESNQLRLQRGRRLIVLGKEGDHKGWWKGKIDDQIGFFPKEYVCEMRDSNRAAVLYGLHDDIP